MLSVDAAPADGERVQVVPSYVEQSGSSPSVSRAVEIQSQFGHGIVDLGSNQPRTVPSQQLNSIVFFTHACTCVQYLTQSKETGHDGAFFFSLPR